MTNIPNANQSHHEPYRIEQVRLFNVENPLIQFAHNVASQDGEDGIIQKIFEIVQPQNNYCVEFGAWDGKFLSNCFNLIANKDWSGCYIEANENKFQDLLNNHGTNSKVTCVNKFVEFEGENSLDNILASVNTPINFDFLSIDVDGTDFFIWESLNVYKPNVLVIEFNPTIPNDIVFVQAKNSSVNQGCSLLALIILGKQKGYELVCCTGWNAFFVKAEFYPLFNISNNHITNIYQPRMDGRIFHGYDSYIYVHGMPSLVWSGVQLCNEDFQVIPKSLRRFGDAQS